MLGLSTSSAMSTEGRKVSKEQGKEILNNKTEYLLQMNKKMASKKKYVITKNGEYCKDFLFDTIDGFYLTIEIIKDLQDKRPQHIWGFEKYDPNKHIF